MLTNSVVMENGNITQDFHKNNSTQCLAFVLVSVNVVVTLILFTSMAWLPQFTKEQGSRHTKLGQDQIVAISGL